MTHYPIKKFVYIAIFVSLAIILGYAEKLLIPDLFIPGVKLGISNLVVIIILLNFGFKEALFLGLVKSLINGIAFTGLVSSIYSIAGIILSVTVMFYLKKLYVKDKLSVIGISVGGSAVFNVGQLIVASMLFKSFIPMYYLSYYLIISVLTGIVTGIVARIIIEKGVAFNEKIQK